MWKNTYRTKIADVSTMGLNRLSAVAVMIALVLLGCSHDTDFFDGPNLVERFGPFELLEPLDASMDQIDFSAGERVHFTAKFNKRIGYVLTITGMESGAVKVIEGFDSELNQENAVWRGRTTELPLFSLERCMVELIIPDEDSLRSTVEVEVTGLRSYEGELFTGFEEEPLDNIFFGNYEFEFANTTGRRNDGLQGEGEWYYNLAGTDNVVPNFFVGLIDIKSRITGNTYAPLPTTVPEELFFNCFIYNDGRPHGIAVIQFAYDSNNSGEFEDGQDQTFQLSGDFPLNFRGWKHIYHTMADVGMTEAQVQKIVAIRVLLISNMNTQPNPPLEVGYRIDYLTFTSGRELQL